MSNSITANGIRFVIFFMLQVILFKDLSFWGHGSVFCYAAFFLLLPLSLNPLIGLGIGFIAGGLMDLFYQTTAIHAAASTFLMFLRPLLINSLTPRSGYEIYHTATFYDLGWPWYLIYSLTLLLAHHLVVMVLEVFTWNFTDLILVNAFLSLMLTWSAITILLMLSGSRSR